MSTWDLLVTPDSLTTSPQSTGGYSIDGIDDLSANNRIITTVTCQNNLGATPKSLPSLGLGVNNSDAQDHAYFDRTYDYHGISFVLYLDRAIQSATGSIAKYILGPRLPLTNFLLSSPSTHEYGYYAIYVSRQGERISDAI